MFPRSPPCRLFPSLSQEPWLSRGVHAESSWDSLLFGNLLSFSKLKHLCWPQVPNPAQSSLATWRWDGLQVSPSS